MKTKLLFILLLAFAGCEILEEDISRNKVVVLSPADGVFVQAGKVDFHWKMLGGADGYAFMLVSPSFESTERVLADTMICADTLARRFGCEVNLDAGKYEWCVTAFNAGYESKAEVRTLTVLGAEE